MKNYSIRTYTPDDFDLWNDFIAKAKNATFLFHRSFMEYHKDRFEDFSLLVFEDKKLVAVLPANKVREELHSHQGLSYGGIVINNEIRIEDYLKIAENIFAFLKENNINYLYIKSLPYIYHKTLSEEFDFLTAVVQAENYRTDSYFVLDNRLKYNPNRNRKRALRVAESNGITIKEDEDFEVFWNDILSVNLNQRFGVNPVHSVEEIRYLKKHFPENIRLYIAYQNEIPKAGAVLFISDNVVHFQYSSGTEDREETGALDALFDYIIRLYPKAEYISFGSSSENHGQNINFGLAYWKESFGAKCTIQKFLRINVSDISKISNMISL